MWRENLGNKLQTINPTVSLIWEASSAVAKKKKIQCLSARLIVAAGGANLIRIVAFLCEVSEKEGNVHNQRPEW